MEEPVLYDNPQALAEFARSVSVPVSTGEELYTRWEFRPILEENAVGIIQPDICHAGGLSEMMKIAAMAETYYTMVSPHNSNGPLSTVAVCTSICALTTVTCRKSFSARYRSTTKS